MALPTNFENDVLDPTMDGRRRYNMITNSDGTVSFVDMTTYSRVGSTFGASEINAQNDAINDINENLAEIDTKIGKGLRMRDLDYDNLIDVTTTKQKAPKDGVVYIANSTGTSNLEINGIMVCSISGGSQTPLFPIKAGQTFNATSGWRQNGSKYIPYAD